MTGWAQINGWRGEVDTPEKIQKRVECDVYYIENWSILFDLKILFLTPFRCSIRRTPIEHRGRTFRRCAANACARRCAGQSLGNGALWLAAFLSGFVIEEPAPYELYMVLLSVVWLACGLKLRPRVRPTDHLPDALYRRRPRLRADVRRPRRCGDVHRRHKFSGHHRHLLCGDPGRRSAALPHHPERLHGQRGICLPRSG